MLQRASRLGIEPRIVRDGAWVAGGQILSALGALLSIRIMTELLAPEEFGRLTLLIGIGALALGLSVGPLLQAVLRFYADWRRRGEGGVFRAASAALVTPVVVVAGSVIALAGWLAGPAYGQPAAVGLLIAALFAVDAARSFELVLFNAARRQKPTAFLYAADAWSRPAVAVAAVWLWGASAASALAGYILASALVVAAVRFLTPLEGRTRHGSAPDGLRFLSTDAGRELAGRLLRYALPLAPLGLFGWFNGVGDRYLIAGMIGLDEAGLYAAAYGLVSRPFLMLCGIVELTMRPVLNDAVAAGDRRKADRARRAWLLIAGAGSALGAAGFLALSPLIASLLLAPGYRPAAASLMPWIALGSAFFNMAVVHMRICYAFNDTRSVLALTAMSAVATLAVLIPLLHVYGLIGAAMAVPLYFGLQWAMAFAVARRAEAAFYRHEAPMVPAGKEAVAR